jgi:hypothetical protein
MRIASRFAITFGLALAAIALGAGTASAATFSNTAPIAIPQFGNASPYPSQITVSGQTAPITDLNVNLNGYSHTEALDVGVVLVGPGGEKLLLMCYVGAAGVTNLNLKLDDSVGIQLPSSTGTLTSGSFKPASHCGFLPSFPSPGPGTAYGNPGPGLGGTATLASTFNGAGANGTWSLFVGDFVGIDSGQFAGGWSLEISPDPAITKKKCKKGRKLKKGKCVKKKRKKK